MAESLACRVKSINIGKVKDMETDKTAIKTAFIKNPIDEKVTLSKFGFAGDEHAYEGHGGPDKAICVFSYEHYPYWKEELGTTVDNALFGENLTVYGLTETEVHIGDIFTFGDAVIQVSEPRGPCHIIAKRYGNKKIPLVMQETGETGFYCRVLKEAAVSSNDPIKLLEAHPEKISIKMINRALYGKEPDTDILIRIISINALAEDTKETLKRKLAKHT